MVALLAAWAGAVLTEVVAPRFTTFVILWGVASAGPLVATWLWARAGRTRPAEKKRPEREEGEKPAARRDLERERRILGALWGSALLTAIAAALLARWLCPEASVALPMAMAGLLLLPTAVYIFLVRPGASK